MKFPNKFLASMLAAILLIVGSAVFVQSVAIRGISGLAVAQSSIRFNAVKDGAAGDALSTGVLVTGLYSFNGATFDRLRGTIANGLDVDLTRLPGTISLADNTGNPSNALPVGSFVMGFDGSTWDRIRGNSVDGLDVNVVNAAALQSPTEQSGTLFNSNTAGADDTAVTVTIPAAVGERVHIYRLGFRCFPETDADTSNASIRISPLGTLLWVSQGGAMSSDETTVTWPVPFTSDENQGLDITVPACGVGNSNRINIQADRF